MYAVPRFVLTVKLVNAVKLRGRTYIVDSLACPDLEFDHRIQRFLADGPR